MTPRFRHTALALACVALLPANASAQFGWPRSTPPPASSSSDYGTPASPELARTIALVGTVIPIGAGAVTWAVQGKTSATSWVLMYFGSVEGPALGYHYALSKRTTVYADAIHEGRDNMADNLKSTGYDLGIKHNF